MKTKILACILSAALIVPCFVCASSVPESIPDDVIEFDISDIGDNPMNAISAYMGTYFGDDYRAMVWPCGPRTVSILVQKPLDDGIATWKMSGQYERSSKTVTYDNCEYSFLSYINNEKKTVLKNAEPSSGTFIFDDDNKLIWQDSTFESSINMEYRNMFDFNYFEDYKDDWVDSVLEDMGLPEEAMSVIENARASEEETETLSREEFMSNPILKRIGVYYKGNYSILIAPDGAENVLIVVTKPLNTTDMAVWVMRGEYDEDSDEVSYSNGIKMQCIESDEESETVTDYSDGSGTIAFDYMTLTWTDDVDHELDGKDFHFLG